MPTILLNSSVITWPDLKTVHQAIQTWSGNQVAKRADLLCIGYFGSYARGDWGVNSDLDLILIIESSDITFWERSLEWNVIHLPVPVDLLVYTRDEWQQLKTQNDHFARMITREAIWVYERDKQQGSVTKGEYP